MIVQNLFLCSVPQKDRFKFVDDLSVIEIIRIIDKILSYNFRNHVASDIGAHAWSIYRRETVIVSTIF